MKTFFTTYFNTDKLNLFILLTYRPLKNQQKIKLEETFIFKNEKETLDYINHKKLKLINRKTAKEDNEIEELKNLINEYFKKKNIDLFEGIKHLNIELDLKNKFKTDFSQKVIQYLLETKPGDVITYSEIANKIGSKGYRAVGNILRNNPLPLIIPCHRVIRKSGDIGGFGGSTGETWETALKKSLLELEGFKEASF
ncbi:MAG: methylated-DNA--[protein]-cysteine S-methyltransferase [Promethearchaeota archaeon]